MASKTEDKEKEIETKTETETETEAEEGSVKFSDLKEVVREVVAEMLPSRSSSTKSTSRASSGAGIAEEVQAQLAKIKADEDAKAEKTSVQTTLADLKAKVERPPVERRRIHKVMGWGENS